MAKVGLRLSRAHRSCIYSSILILFITGLIWLIQKYYPTEQNDFSISHSSVDPVLMKIHGAAAMIFLILIGTLLFDHMLAGWIADKNRKTGFFMLLFNVTLIITGYLLYYASSESTRNLASISHSIIGIIIPVLIFFHQKRYRSIIGGPTLK